MRARFVSRTLSIYCVLSPAYVTWSVKLTPYISAMHLPTQILYPIQTRPNLRYKNPFSSQSHLHDKNRDAKVKQRTEKTRKMMILAPKKNQNGFANNSQLSARCSLATRNKMAVKKFLYLWISYSFLYYLFFPLFSTFPLILRPVFNIAVKNSVIK